MNRALLILGLGVVTAVAAACWTLRRTQLGPSRIETAGVVARVVEAQERASRPLGVVPARGDVVLSSDALRVVVAGGERDDVPLGAVLEASLADGEGLARGATVTPVLTRGERSFPLRFETFRLVRRGDNLERVAMRLRGSATIDGHEVTVFLEYRVSDDRHALMISTQVVAPVELSLAPGFLVGWGGHTPFVPGYGRLASALRREAVLVGIDIRTASGYAGAAFYADGSPLIVQADTTQHGPTVELRPTLLTLPSVTHAPGVAVGQRFGLSLSDHGLADAARRVGWLQGRPFPQVSVYVPRAPEDTRVRLRKHSGPVILDAHPDDRGVAMLPLLLPEDPDDPFVVTAEAFGHAPSETRRVRAGQSLTLEIPKGGRVQLRAGDLLGTPIPVRVRILGREGTETPNLGPDYVASGAGEAVFSVSGEALIPLPPGDYRIIVSHGPEWSIAVSDVRITEGMSPEIDARLEHVVPPAGWIASDFHVHQSPSDDSEVSIEDRVATLVAEGISFAVPTDHNHVTSYAAGVEVHRLTDFGTVTGVELTTWDPNLGHFNVFPFPLDEQAPRNGAPPYIGREPAEMFAAMHALGPHVLVQVNHPRLEPNIGFFDLVGFNPTTGRATGPYDAGFDLLEVWNGYDLARPDVVDRVFQEWLAMLESGHRVVATGNSDSHPVRYHWAGYPRTYVYVPEGPGEPLEVLKALRAGRVFVTSGPFLEARVGGAGPGSRVAAAGGFVDLDVLVRAPRYIDVEELQVYVGRTLVTTLPIRHPAPVVETGPAAQQVAPPIVRLRRRIRVPVERDATLVVRVRSSTPMDEVFGRRGVVPVAFTNPIFVDGDGDGELRWFPPEPEPVDGGARDSGAVDSGAVDAAAADVGALGGSLDAGPRPESAAGAPDGGVTGARPPSE